MLRRLTARLAIAEETLRAIHHGEVDSVVVAGKQGDRVFTLEGAEHAYRVLIESMNEGALTLTPDKTILYANQSFARMVKCPLEQVIGGSFRRFLSGADRDVLRLLMKRAAKSGSKLQVQLLADDGSQIPAQISLRLLARNGFAVAPIGLVVTDLTEARRAEEMLRALTHRVVQVQEDERGRVALELHDHVTQLLCAVLFRSQALTQSLAGRAGPARREAKALQRMLGQTAGEVERISRDLRPGVLGQLGLAAVLRDEGREFSKRTGVTVRLAGVRLTVRLLPATELALYRILQEALRNVEQHAHARHVTVDLGLRDDWVQLAVNDDGIGFNPAQRPSRNGGKHGLGLLGMRERATHLGGTLTIKSLRRTGTEIAARIPLSFANGKSANPQPPAARITLASPSLAR